MSADEPLALVVGRVVKPHGVRGELVVDVRTDAPDERFVPGAVFGVRRRGSGPAAETLELAAVRPHAGRLLVRFEGVSGREEVEELRGALLTVRSDELEPTEDPDEFYDHQLEGLEAVLVGGEVVGAVHEVVHSPAGELLVVRTGDGREVLVPFVSAIVPEVDLSGGRVVIDPPEGLFGES